MSKLNTLKTKLASAKVMLENYEEKLGIKLPRKQMRKILTSLLRYYGCTQYHITEFFDRIEEKEEVKEAIVCLRGLIADYEKKIRKEVNIGAAKQRSSKLLFNGSAGYLEMFPNKNLTSDEVILLMRTYPRITQEAHTFSAISAVIKFNDSDLP